MSAPWKHNLHQYLGFCGFSYYISALKTPANSRKLISECIKKKKNFVNFAKKTLQFEECEKVVRNFQVTFFKQI